MNNDYLKYDGRIPEPPYTTADERRIDELLDEVESLQAENARLRAALVQARHDIADRVPAFIDHNLLAAIDAALEGSI